jgi:hypothetical protein
MNKNPVNNTRFLPLSVAILLLMAGWGVSLLLSLIFKAPFFSQSYSILALSLLILELVFIIPTLIYVRRKRPGRSVLKLLRLNKIHNKAWPGIILFTGGIIIVSDAADRILGNWIAVPEEYLLLMGNYKWTTFPEAVLMIIAACFAASFSEECLFRGVLLQSLEENIKNVLAAIFFSAFFFAMIHALPWYFIQIAVLGILLGGMSYLFDSVIPGIFLHSMYNLVSLLMLNFSGDATWYVANGYVRNIWILFAGLLILAGYYSCRPFFVPPVIESEKDQI